MNYSAPTICLALSCVNMKMHNLSSEGDHRLQMNVVTIYMLYILIAVNDISKQHLKIPPYYQVFHAIVCFSYILLININSFVAICQRTIGFSAT